MQTPKQKKITFPPKSCLFNIESQALSSQTFCATKEVKTFSQFLKQQLVFNSHRRSVSLVKGAVQKRTLMPEKREVLLGGRTSKPSKKRGWVQEPLTQSQTEEQEGLLGMNPPGLVLQQGRQQSDLCPLALLNVRIRRGRRSS